MSGWEKERSIHYDRHPGGHSFYWWCPVCEQSGVNERLSFAMDAGRLHQAVSHGR